MMELATRSRHEIQCTTIAGCLSYSGAVNYDGRRPIKGTEIFRIRCPKTNTLYFEGIPGDSGVIRWSRRSGAPAKLTGTFNRFSGYWSIEFDKDNVSKGEEVSISYDWQPHYLTGAKVMVLLNNEERLVPIEDLQKAICSHLIKDD